MPCNARVVISAKVKVKDMSILPYLINTPIGFTSRLGQYVTMVVNLDNNAVLRYSGDNWDEGVDMLKRAIRTYELKYGVQFSNIGQPETHRHEHAGGMQGVRT